MFGRKAKQEPKSSCDVARDQQTASRQTGAYIPVPERWIAESDAAFERQYRSSAFERLIPAHQQQIAPIIFLHSSAKAMLLAHFEGNGPASPSVLFESLSRCFFESVDATIDDICTDLVVLADNDPSDLEDPNLLSNASLVENDEGCHSLQRYHARLLRQHLSGRGRSGLVAFRQALTALRATGLFKGNEIAPLAIDFFPSLAHRENELLERRAALTWRPETGVDQVVFL
ncbi:hypothetical protein SAMN05444123_101199 [Rhodopseudomonas pseudopalustris]|uniref:Uncharacterized protein n=2 Tax=Rhodopseudomonas pseudopalustris TaxID=1513892 RepID=A0A1H8LS36_9BRAD|nr:hypothetical protein SAMN05444123_101199 [Rhodopseudomonas pseudopalustris]